ncbi:MAG: c-type cytochrome domain-containing protein [Verrucomicrobiota bacterium]|nr:c-type cytochrome domain-containing protein [Verrucomicrobiota bacterium]
MKLLFFFLISVSFAAGIDEAKDGKLVRGFLEVYCIKCHGSEKQKGDRRFDHLSGKAEDLSQAESLK